MCETAQVYSTRMDPLRERRQLPYCPSLARSSALYFPMLYTFMLSFYPVNPTSTLATWCKDPTHWTRPWCWERLRAGGEGDDRGWDGWMASPTQWTWVWVDSGSWWWTGRPGVLQSMGSQSQTWLSDWTTASHPELRETITLPCEGVWGASRPFSFILNSQSRSGESAFPHDIWCFLPSCPPLPHITHQQSCPRGPPGSEGSERTLTDEGTRETRSQ